MTKVLVTGASGFIGQHLVDALLARGDVVTGLVRRAEDGAALGARDVRICVGDVTVRESLTAAIAEQEIVFHVAGLTRAVRSADFFRVNADGTRHVAAACAALESPPRLVMVSSLAAAGPARGRRPRREEDRPQPVSHYGLSKLRAERGLRRVAARVPTSIVRPPIVLGEGDRVSLPLFQSVAQTGVHLIPYYGTHWYSLVHVADLVQLLLAVADRGACLAPVELPAAAGAGDGRCSSARPATASLAAQEAAARGIYFAGCERDVTYRELGQLVARAVGRRRFAPLPVPQAVAWMVGGATEGLKFFTGRSFNFDLDKAREATAGSWNCSIERARRELGYAPAATIAARLHQTAEWYRQAGWLG